MKTDKQLVLFICSLIYWICGFQLWMFLGKEFYYMSVALFITCLVYIIHLNTEKNWRRHITTFALFICFNNLADELFFDPTAYTVNESITVILYLFYLWIKYMKSRNGLN